MAMQTALVLRGKLKDERTIELNEPVRGVEAEVEVIVRPVGSSRPAPLCETLSPEEWKKVFHAWIDSHDRTVPIPSAESLRREGIYEDRL
jgi:hypothetical protein